MCRILVKAQVLTGDDAHSRIGTKHAALPYDPLEFLKKMEIQTIYAKKSWNEPRNGEDYLIKVRAGARNMSSLHTFQLRQLNLPNHWKDYRQHQVL